MDQELTHRICREIALGAPYFALSSGHLILKAAELYPSDIEELRRLLQAWIEHWRVIEQFCGEVADHVMPQLEELGHRLGAQKAEDELQQLFDEEVRSLTGQSKPDPESVRPSKVTDPGPLKNLRIEGEVTEDEFRRNIIAWDSAIATGRVDPLFYVDGNPFFGYGLRERLYLPRRIKRLWGSVERDVDQALMEDFLAIVSLVCGKLTCRSRTAWSVSLQPYLRRYDYQGCCRVGLSAVEELERLRVLRRSKARTWVLSSNWIEPVRKELLGVWIEACGLGDRRSH